MKKNNKEKEPVYVSIHIPTGIYIARGTKEYVQEIAVRSQFHPFKVIEETE